MVISFVKTTFMVKFNLVSSDHTKMSQEKSATLRPISQVFYVNFHFFYRLDFWRCRKHTWVGENTLKRRQVVVNDCRRKFLAIKMVHLPSVMRKQGKLNETTDILSQSGFILSLFEKDRCTCGTTVISWGNIIYLAVKVTTAVKSYMRVESFFKRVLQ